MAHIVGTKELGEITGLSDGQIRTLSRSGLPSHRVGGRLAFDVTEALAWLDDAGMLEPDDEEGDDEEDLEEDEGEDGEGDGEAEGDEHEEEAA